MQPFAGASKPSNRTRTMSVFGLIWPGVKVFLCGAHIASRQRPPCALAERFGQNRQAALRSETTGASASRESDPLRVYTYPRPMSRRGAAGARPRIKSKGNRPVSPDQVGGGLLPNMSLMGRAVVGRAMPPRRPAGVRRRALPIIQSSAAEPPLRHPGPYGSIFGVARELGHGLAFGGKSQEFL
jgi:hypothetical protein